MACCGGGHKNVRKQVVGRKLDTTKRVVQRTKSTAPKTVRIMRQYIVSRQKCPKCGCPTMSVNIAKRERTQCSNANCRYVL